MTDMIKIDQCSGNYLHANVYLGEDAGAKDVLGEARLRRDTYALLISLSFYTRGRVK